MQSGIELLSVELVGRFCEVIGVAVLECFKVLDATEQALENLRADVLIFEVEMF